MTHPLRHNGGMTGNLGGRILLRQVRVVPVGGLSAPAEPVDVRVDHDVITAVAPRLTPQPDEEVVRAEGRYAIPGLWDQHVHLSMWAPTMHWLDLSSATSAAHAVRLVADHLSRSDTGTTVLTGYGHRSAMWPDRPSVPVLDAVTGARPVVLISGDAHTGWLNTVALRLLGAPETGFALTENDWFAVLARLDELPGAREVTDDTYRTALDAAARKGIVGVVDMEFRDAYLDWPARVARGLDRVRVRTAVYPEQLDDVVAAGLGTETPLPHGAGLVTMGPLKIISDGSLNTRTACCHEPYADAAGWPDPCGRMNYTETELDDLFTTARRGRLTVAVHALGDRAVATALDLFESTGAAGSVEHAQLMAPADIARSGALGVRISVQPAHLIDDRDPTMQCWPDRSERCFPFRSLLDAGTEILLGSDAPVAALDPWLAMSAAVHRSGDDRPPWHPEQSITAAEALAASVDGQSTVSVGGRGDVVLLDQDPLAEGDTARVAASLRAMPVAATIVGGRVTHQVF